MKRDVLRRLVELEAKTRPLQVGEARRETHFDRRWNAQTQQWEDYKPGPGDYLKGAATVGTIGAGYLGHRAIQQAGGYGALGNRVMGGAKDFLGGRVAAAKAGAATGAQIGAGAEAALKGAGKDTLDAIRKKLLSLRGMVPKFSAGQQERLVELAAGRNARPTFFEKKHNEAESTPMGPQPNRDATPSYRRGVVTGALVGGLATAGAAHALKTSPGMSERINIGKQGIRLGYESGRLREQLRRAAGRFRAP